MLLPYAETCSQTRTGSPHSRTRLPSRVLRKVKLLACDTSRSSCDRSIMSPNLAFPPVEPVLCSFHSQGRDCARGPQRPKEQMSLSSKKKAARSNKSLPTGVPPPLWRPRGLRIHASPPSRGSLLPCGARAPRGCRGPRACAACARAWCAREITKQAAPQQQGCFGPLLPEAVPTTPGGALGTVMGRGVTNLAAGAAASSSRRETGSTWCWPLY